MREEAACLMDCLRAGSNAARCRRTFGTGSVVSSRQASRKYVLKNLQGAKFISIKLRLPPFSLLDEFVGSRNAAYFRLLNQTASSNCIAHTALQQVSDAQGPQMLKSTV